MKIQIKILMCTTILSFSYLITGCQSNKVMKEEEIYTFLETCFENYYKNYDINIHQILHDFEKELIAEGHLKDTSGQAYKDLLVYLNQNLYFQTPLKKGDFNNVVLYKNPTQVYDCALDIFSLDSTSIMDTHFAKIQTEIQQTITSQPEVSIHYFFDLYTSRLTNEELESPYIKQTIQLLLYRWYFKSKYDREIPIDQE